MDRKLERANGRHWDELRPVKIEPDFVPSAAGSCLISCGNTRVICTVSIDDGVPAFLENTGMGWLTAEYGMLPASTGTRSPREKTAESGRTREISRLIGRSLRAIIDKRRLGPRTVTVDCDVVQADGGTRTASITGSFVALSIAVQRLMKVGRLHHYPIMRELSAVSLGVVRDNLLLDLDYSEDSVADIDCNLVATPAGDVVEWQTTAERALLPISEMNHMLELGMRGIYGLIDVQRDVIRRALKG